MPRQLIAITAQVDASGKSHIGHNAVCIQAAIWVRDLAARAIRFGIGEQPELPVHR
jgi:methionyl-tRNA synthetase